MLSLEAPTRTIGGVDLAADDADPFTFYVLPPAPRVVTIDGAPQVSLLRLVRDGELVGGNLDLVVELAHPEGRVEAARQALIAQLDDDRDRVRLHPAPLIAAEAELLFVGGEPTPEGGVTAPRKKSFHRVTPTLDAPHRATFSTPLDVNAVTLIEAALRSGGAPIGIIYRLQVEGLRPAHRIVVHVDWGRVYDHFSSHVTEGFVVTGNDVAKLVEQLVESKAIRIQVVNALLPEGGDEDQVRLADIGPSLAWIQREIIERCCEPIAELDREPARASLGVVGTVLGVGASFAVRAHTQIERVIADIDFQRATAVVRTLVAQAHLASLLGDSAPDAHIADAGVHHPFFERAALRVTTARPLAATFVSEAVARFRYGTTEIPIRLTADAPEGSAETWADQAPDRTWSLPIDVTLAGDSPIDPGARVSIEPLSGQSRAIALDLEQLLGLRRVEVQGTPDPRVLVSRVEIGHERGGALIAEPQAVTLSAGSARGEVWFRDVRPEDRLKATTKHLLADGRAVDVGPIVVDTRIFRLPPAFPGSMTVELLADDDWSELERVVVSLQKQADLPAGAVILDKPGASIAVSLDMPDPTDRSYRYKVARTLAGGGIEEDEWVTTDRSALIVGRVAGDVLVVDVTPVGLELPEAGVQLVEVELQYVDPKNQVLNQETAVLRARADRHRWRVPLKDPNLRGYEYRITVYRKTGDKQVGRWTASTDRILLVPITQ